MAYHSLVALRVAAQIFGGFVLFDTGASRLKGGGVTSGVILPLGLIDGDGRKSQAQTARVWDKIWQRQPLLILNIVISRKQHRVLRNYLHLRLPHPKKT